MKVLQTHSRNETVELGLSFAGTLKPGDVVALFGDLGSGKTQFVTGVCEGLHVQGHVASPTFTMIHEYPVPWGMVAHVDLYRIRSRGEIRDLGLEEYFSERCICLIEWAEAVLDLLPPHHHEVRISFGEGDEDREIVIHEPEETTA